jgi:DNA-binding winged helix-turn-helix (wHTH) protein
VPKRLGDIVSERALASFAGRKRELAALLALLEEGGPLVFHVHGVAGIGKSSLLEAFAARARARRARVVRIDCRAVEPTPRGFLAELSEALGSPLSTVEDAARRLSGFPETVVITLDTYEVFRLLDSWMRQIFVASLPEKARVLIADRNPPSPAWRTAPGWQGLFRSLRLEPLAERDALAYLASSGVAAATARRLNRVARGHPLALTMAASLAQAEPGRAVEEKGLRQVIDELSRTYVDEVPDPITREVLVASSVARCVTEPLLHALLPDVAPRDAMARLGALPFVELGRDGLFVHDAVRDAISASLATRDPDAHRDYRYAVWTYLQDQLHRAGSAELWRYMADLLFLLQNPVLREGFFPSGPHPLAVETALPEDEGVVRRIIARQAATEGEALLAWWRHHRDGFHVVRNRDGNVCGFYAMIRASELHHAVASADPVAEAWRRAAAGRHPPSALFCRRILDRDAGEGPSGSQAACWVDLKRTYVEMRTTLRWVYVVYLDPAPFAEAMTRLGFRPLAGSEIIEVGKGSFRSFLLDMGSGSVDSWLAGLVGHEIASDGARAPKMLDVEARELVLPSGRVGLTSLELGVMRYLLERPGKAVSRYDLMQAVWGYKSATASNVVDVVIRSLRKKLGPQARAVETVRGTGYRYRKSPAEGRVGSTPAAGEAAGH